MKRKKATKKKGIIKETKKNTYRLEKNQTSLGNVQVGVERG